MTRRKPSLSSPFLPETPAIVRLWMLRLLVPLGGHRSFINTHGFSNDSLAELLGLGEWIDSELREFSPSKVRAQLRRVHQDAERTLKGAVVPTCLRANVARMSALVGLSAGDCRVLELAVLSQNERLLDEAADQMAAFFVNLPPCLIGMEACGSAHHWGAQAAEHGLQGSADGSAVRQALRQNQQERCGRRRSHLRSGRAAEHAFRPREERGATSSPGAAPGPAGIRAGAHRAGEPDPRTIGRVRPHRAVGHRRYRHACPRADRRRCQRTAGCVPTAHPAAA